ncbi:MAG: family 4 glycosyl hydrolase [Candidatus Humimicrobiaceae bacterium]
MAEKRFDLWGKDYYIPAAFGFRHIFGENGGPGAAFHALRSLNLMMPICKDIEKICPKALLINFTNPESRVCLGISKITKVKNVGLCHGPVQT